MSSPETLFDVASCLGKELNYSSKILDFGCGNGEKVKTLREKGYDAYGVDVKFKPGPNVERLQREGTIQLIEMDNYQIPFPDDYFDFVFSHQVFEHVQNYDETLRELARVMKYGASGLHRFPSRLRPLESHVKVPFSSVFRPLWWMVLWTWLGFHKSLQKGRPTLDVARENLKYLESNTNYLSGRTLSSCFGRFFREFRHVETCWFEHSPNQRGRIFGRLSRLIPLMHALYRVFWTRVVYHVKK